MLRMKCVLFSLMYCTAPHSQEIKSPFDSTKPYSTPDYAFQGITAAQEKIAQHVGAEILQKGGNAVDAAVAMGFALAVTLPEAGNLGGGGFMLVWLNKEKKAVVINYRETAPAGATKNMFLNAQGEVDSHAATLTLKATGVPGTPAGLILALRKYGTLPLKTVMQPAIRLAEKGFPVSLGLAMTLKSHQENLEKSSASKRIFFIKNSNETLKTGDILVQKDLAATLKLIAHKGTDGFYKGKIAQRLVDFMAKNGGLITQKDLADYHPEIVEPVVSSYKGYKVVSVPPPSSGGITLIEMLNMLETLTLSGYSINSAQDVHTLTEVMNLAFNDRNSLLGDPNFVSIPVDKLISKEYAQKLAKKVNPKEHTLAVDISARNEPDHESKQTTHFSVVDKEGNMVSNTYTLNYSYGNGIIVPGTGFLLNNEMDDFTAKPGTPNSYGLVQGSLNSIAPGKRPLSSMTPVIIIDEKNNRQIATGSPGGSTIITVVLQQLLNVIDFKMNIAEANNACRIHSQLYPDEVAVEACVSSDTIKILNTMGHKVSISTPLGSVQTVEKSPDGLFYRANDLRGWH